MILITPAYAASGGSFIESPETWIAFTFFMILIIVFKPASKAFKSLMIDQVDKIQDKITKAKTLRNDTEKLLQDYLKKQKNVEDEIKSIVEDSKKQAEQLRKDAEIRLKEIIEVKEKQIMDNIALLESNAFSEINSKITEVALNAAQTIITDSMNTDKNNKLVSKFVSEFPETVKKIN